MPTKSNRLFQAIPFCLTALALLFLSASGCKDKDQTGKPLNELTTTALDSLQGNLPAVLQRMAQGDTVKVICYGNSITYGVDVEQVVRVDSTYPDALQAGLRAYFNNTAIHVINQGIGGWTAEQAFGASDSLVTGLSPHLVIIEFGINDKYQGYSPESYALYLDSLVAHLQQQDITVLLMSPTPLATSQEAHDDLKHFGEAARQVAINRQVAFFDMHTAMVRRINNSSLPLETIMPDYIHYGPDYYVWIAEELLAFLKDVE